MKQISMSKLEKKAFKTMDSLSTEWSDCLGLVEPGFSAIIWGASANGKSNFTMQLVKELARQSSVLYVALEESFSITTQSTIRRNGLDEGGKGKIWFANHETDYEALTQYLKRKRSAKIIVIDSLQYFNLSYIQYKHLKEGFPGKAFIFISHAKGKIPDGKTADKIRYDAGIKIRVEGFIAFVTSRYGGNKNYVVWEDGAKGYWKKDFKKHLKR